MRAEPEASPALHTSPKCTGRKEYNTASGGGGELRGSTAKGWQEGAQRTPAGAVSGGNGQGDAHAQPPPHARRRHADERAAVQALRVLARSRLQKRLQPQRHSARRGGGKGAPH